MRYYYAMINENNIVIGVSNLSGEVEQPDMIRIDEYDGSLLGKLYEDNEFKEG